MDGGMDGWLDVITSAIALIKVYPQNKGGITLRMENEVTEGRPHSHMLSSWNVKSQIRNLTALAGSVCCVGVFLCVFCASLFLCVWSAIWNLVSVVLASWAFSFIYVHRDWPETLNQPMLLEHDTSPDLWICCLISLAFNSRRFTIHFQRWLMESSVILHIQCSITCGFPKFKTAYFWD